MPILPMAMVAITVALINDRIYLRVLDLIGRYIVR